MGCQLGVFNKSGSFGKECGEGNKQDGNNQYALQDAENDTPGAVDPAEKSDVHQIFYDDAQNTDGDEDPTKYY